MRTGSMRVAEISLPAIRHNVRRLREFTGAEIIAVVKANGYGHGAEFAARAAVEGGAALLGVADLEEALALRALGVTHPVLCWLHGVGVDFEAAIEADIEAGVSHLAQLDALAAAARAVGRPAITQLKIDTGLSRNGASPDEWAELFARAAELEGEGLVRVRGIFSHLANAGEHEDRAQADRLNAGAAMLREAGCEPQLVHLAASAAAFRYPDLGYNAVRVGMAIYGLSPFADKSSEELGLIPAMTLRSEIVAMRPVPAGTGVSYGYNHVAQSDTTLGLVPIGYADGMPRALNGAGATVEVAGRHCPIVGRIGMDQCIIDLGRHARKVELGDRVVLFGDPATGVPPVEVWAEVMGTINYEIVAGIGSRVLRVAVDDAAESESQVEPVETQEPPISPGSTGSLGETRGLQGEVTRSHPPQARTQTLTIEDPDAMHELGMRLGGRLAAGDLVILTGPLGAGKTTLSRGIGEGLGVRGPVTSPTFVLARTHPSLTGGAPLVHLDAYRLADAAELDDLDLDFEGSVVLAEWGAGLIEPGESWVEIVIERPTGAAAQVEVGETTDASDDLDELIEPRTVTLTWHGLRWAEGVLP